MNFEVPEGHFLVCYDYGMGGLWWFVKAGSPGDIRKAAPELTVLDEVPDWMSNDDWKLIDKDDLKHPKSEALRMILARQK